MPKTMWTKSIDGEGTGWKNSLGREYGGEGTGWDADPVNPHTKDGSEFEDEKPLPYNEKKLIDLIEFGDAGGPLFVVFGNQFWRVISYNNGMCKLQDPFSRFGQKHHQTKNGGPQSISLPIENVVDRLNGPFVDEEKNKIYEKAEEWYKKSLEKWYDTLEKDPLNENVVCDNSFEYNEPRYVLYKGNIMCISSCDEKNCILENPRAESNNSDKIVEISIFEAQDLLDQRKTAEYKKAFSVFEKRNQAWLNSLRKVEVKNGFSTLYDYFDDQKGCWFTEGNEDGTYLGACGECGRLRRSNSRDAYCFCKNGESVHVMLEDSSPLSKKDFPLMKKKGHWFRKGSIRNDLGNQIGSCEGCGKVWVSNSQKKDVVVCTCNSVVYVT